MGISAGQPVHARHRHAPDRRYDRGKAQRRASRCRGWAVRTACLITFLCLCGIARADPPQPIRFVSFNVELTRKGPGLLARDLMRGKDKQIASIIARILRLRPDVLALQSIDYDYDHVAAGLLKDTLAAAGHPMPHHFARAPNTGVPTPFDLDRNGYLGDARDMQGYGKFTGQGGMLLLSRFRILQQDARDFTALIWEDVPDAQMPIGYFSPSETDILRLHTVGAWDVPVDTPSGPVRVLMSHAGPPVFDGPEDRNGLRNADEIRFWASYVARMSDPFVVMADLNNDPVDGEGLKPALQALLEAPQIIDPAPSHSRGTDTVDWGFDDLRVDYVLPSADFRVVASGVDWPVSEGEDEVGPRHKPVWVDLVVK